MSREVMQQALEAIEDSGCKADLMAAADALRAALAEQAQPTSEAGWLHRLDMEKSEAWLAGYAQGLKRAAEQAQPVTECIDDICSEHSGRVEAFDHLPAGTKLYTTPPAPQPVAWVAKNWSVFNTGAEVASGLSLDEAMDYLTDGRAARGWSVVCVINKDNMAEPTPPTPVAPPGWQMVPVEPTEEMIEQGYAATITGTVRGQWAAMLAAAPVHQPVHGWPAADADAARLALELECLLTDKDVPLPTASRWWESAHEALRLHRERLAAAPEAPTPPAPQPLTERDLELLDGMIEVQLQHAAQCDLMLARAGGNHIMAERQKGWDMERVELLRKIKRMGVQR